MDTCLLSSIFPNCFLCVDLGASTSGVSTVNSAGHGANLGNNPEQGHHFQQLSQLREENSRLLGQLVEMQQNFQDLLRHNLSEQRLHYQFMMQNVQIMQQSRAG